MIEVGTRMRQNALHIRPDQGRDNRGFSRDVGLKPNVTASCTFGGGQVAAANGTFASFAAGEVVLVQGVNLNCGFFTATGVDLTNGAFLTLDPPPKAEGPVTATIRTA